MSGRPPFAVLFLFALSVLLLVIFGSLVLERNGSTQANGNRNAPAARTAPEITFVDPSRGGSPGSPAVVVFGDYQCPFCGQLEKELAVVRERRPDVRIVWKNLPIRSQHPQAETAAEAALCAGKQGKFWEMHDALFATGVPGAADLYGPLIASVGLDAAAFNACLTNGATLPLVNRTVDEAVALGIDGIPYIFAGTERFSGFVAADALLSALPPIR